MGDQNLSFIIKHKESSCKARTGILRLTHGDVKTPVFMPVGTNGTVKALTVEDIKERAIEYKKRTQETVK